MYGITIVPHSLCWVKINVNSLVFFSVTVSKTFKKEYSCKIRKAVEFSKEKWEE
jgi:hypothetical protein